MNSLAKINRKWGKIILVSWAAVDIAELLISSVIGIDIITKGVKSRNRKFFLLFILSVMFWTASHFIFVNSFNMIISKIFAIPTATIPLFATSFLLLSALDIKREVNKKDTILVLILPIVLSLITSLIILFKSNSIIYLFPIIGNQLNLPVIINIMILIQIILYLFLTAEVYLWLYWTVESEETKMRLIIMLISIIEFEIIPFVEFIESILYKIGSPNILHIELILPPLLTLWYAFAFKPTLNSDISPPRWRIYLVAFTALLYTFAIGSLIPSMYFVTLYFPIVLSLLILFLSSGISILFASHRNDLYIFFGTLALASFIWFIENIHITIDVISSGSVPQFLLPTLGIRVSYIVLLFGTFSLIKAVSKISLSDIYSLNLGDTVMIAFMILGFLSVIYPIFLKYLPLINGSHAAMAFINILSQILNCIIVGIIFISTVVKFREYDIGFSWLMIDIGLLLNVVLDMFSAIFEANEMFLLRSGNILDLLYIISLSHILLGTLLMFHWLIRKTKFSSQKIIEKLFWI